MRKQPVPGNDDRSGELGPGPGLPGQGDSRAAGAVIAAWVNALAGHGEAPALIDVRNGALETRSFAELATSVARLSAGLLRCGVANGEAVAVAAGPTANAVTAALALLRMGAAPVLVPVGAGAEEVAGIATRAGCRRVFITEARLAELGPAFFGQDAEVYLLDRSKAKRCGIPSWDSLFAEPGRESP